MTAPLVSVFMPTYNHEHFIADAIRSAAEQSYENVEIVVGDDGSSDGTRQQIEACVRRYGSKVVVAGHDRVGIVANHNRVLRACRGKYLAMTSGDDLFLPEKIARQVAWMEQDERRIVCGHRVEAFDSDTGRVLYDTGDTMRMTSGFGAAAYVSRMQLFPGISTFIRRTAVPAHGYDERVGLVSDFKFVADVLASGGAYGYIDGVFARYRVHPDSISQRNTREAGVRQQYTEGFLVALALLEAAHPELVGACSTARAGVYFAAARARQLAGDRRAARAYFGAALRQKPSYLKAAAGLALSILPARGTA